VLCDERLPEDVVAAAALRPSEGRVDPHLVAPGSAQGLVVVAVLEVRGDALVRRQRGGARQARRCPARTRLGRRVPRGVQRQLRRVLEEDLELLGPRRRPKRSRRCGLCGRVAVREQQQPVARRRQLDRVVPGAERRSEVRASATAAATAEHAVAVAAAAPALVVDSSSSTSTRAGGARVGRTSSASF
jgi:hypothetical protein